MIKSIIIVFVIVSILMVGGRMYYVSGNTGVSDTGTSTFPETEYIGSAYSSSEDNTVIIDGTVLQAMM